MRAERTKHVLAALTGSVDDEALTLTTLCRRMLEVLSVTGSSVALMSRGHTQGLAGASDSTAGAVQDLEFTLGEGPGVEAFAEGDPVLVDDLHAVDGRWPNFTGAALGLGVRALWALPLQVGAIRLGVLTLYRDQPGAITDELLVDSLLVADLTTHLVLALQSEAAAESLAWALYISDYRVVVHQATGMISAQLDCSIEEALVRLRGHAFAAERPIDEMADAVVSGYLRFDVA